MRQNSSRYDHLRQCRRHLGLLHEHSRDHKHLRHRRRNFYRLRHRCRDLELLPLPLLLQLLPLEPVPPIRAAYIRCFFGMRLC